MADTALAEDSPEAAAPPAKKGGLKKLILFVGAPLLLLGGIAAALFFTPLGHMVGLGSSSADVAETKINRPPAFFDIPELLVNINAGGKRAGFLKISVSLEVEDAEKVPQIQAILPRIIDNFQTYLRELRLEDLKGSAGLYRLREELLLRVNAAAAPAKITDVLFKEMLVQ